ncbi:MAG TPA: DUF4097 family beta strand repeat-containing protein [Chthoniobacterales bacterium]|nr:DUF4097 family beta strand repeat-containing protein [Chthoniobacterales bacterium]
MKFVANFCGVSRVVEETRNHYAESTCFCTAHHDPPRFSCGADCTDLAGDGLLHTTNGSITLALPRSADALIDATTTVGQINSNLSAGKVNKGIVGGTLEAKLGAGSHHLEAKTTNGTISLEAR